MRIVYVMLAISAVACGGGDDGGSDGDGDGADAGENAPADAAAIDAAAGTQGPGQFCNTSPDGGPYCTADLECCEDNVCRLPEDCSGSSGFLPCECTAECSSSFICCDTAEQTFCTKRSACNDYGGSEIATCP